MSDMEEVEGPEGPVAPHRVIGTPPPTPRLLGSGDGPRTATRGMAPRWSRPRSSCRASRTTPRTPTNAEKVVAFCFVLAFIAGCGFIAAYIGLEVHSVDAVRRRSNLALGLSLSVALLGLGLGALIWVRHIMPDAEVVEERHADALDATPSAQAFAEYFAEATGASQFVKRPIVRRTLMLATLPLAAIPVVAAARPGPAARHQPAAHGVEPGPAAAGLRHQPADHAGRVQRAGRNDHHRARRLHRRLRTRWPRPRSS